MCKLEGLATGLVITRVRNLLAKIENFVFIKWLRPVLFLDLLVTAWPIKKFQFVVTKVNKFFIGHAVTSRTKNNTDCVPCLQAFNTQYKPQILQTCQGWCLPRMISDNVHNVCGFGKFALSSRCNQFTITNSPNLSTRYRSLTMKEGRTRDATSNSGWESERACALQRWQFAETTLSRNTVKIR